MAAGVAVLGLSRLSWQDDVYALSVPPRADWLQEDNRVRERVSQMDVGRFVVAVGDDEQEALRLNDEVHQRLLVAREQGLLEGFRSLHTFLFSAELQQRNLRSLAARPALVGDLSNALEDAGFRSEAFAPFAQALADEAGESLQYSELVASPLADLVTPFRVDLEGRVAILTFLSGVSDGERLAALLAEGVGGGQGAEQTRGAAKIHYFEQKSFLQEVYGRYRARTTGLILVGLVAVLALLQLRYRSVRLALATAVPALASAATTLALLSLFAIPINLLHMLGLLLVLSIGVDYAIFLVASGADAKERAASMLSLCVACASTCLAFGLLSVSSFPALQALGLTTGIGVLLSLLLAPGVLLLVDPNEVTRR